MKRKAAFIFIVLCRKVWKESLRGLFFRPRQSRFYGFRLLRPDKAGLAMTRFIQGIFIAGFWHKAGGGVLNLSFFIRYVKFLAAKNLV